LQYFLINEHLFIHTIPTNLNKAHMPHGIEAIKSHLQEVDNVPLLVSLFTDATPVSVKQMVQVFRDNGEVVLTIGELLCIILMVCNCYESIYEILSAHSNIRLVFCDQCAIYTCTQV
jgi:hypothetical protein